MARQQHNFRLPARTVRLIDDLAAANGDTRTGIIIAAVERLHALASGDQIENAPKAPSTSRDSAA